jgi:hypothetical protein
MELHGQPQPAASSSTRGLCRARARRGLTRARIPGVPDEDPIAHRHRLLKPHLTADELRVWAAAAASVLDPDATATLARITGIPEAEISRAQQQLATRAKTDPTTPGT